MELIFSKGRPGRTGSTLPERKTPLSVKLPGSLKRREKAALPELSELEVVRHFVNLSRKNFSLDGNFYPLGSCTMKYNPKFHEKMAALEGFAGLHPMLPYIKGGAGFAGGALAVLFDTEEMLSELLGFDACSLQPMAGANGELAGVMVMSAYFKKRGESKRRIMLIPDAAHGTNPASAALAGFECQVIKSDASGDVDLEDLKAHLSDEVAGLMLTCPNTLGLFDKNVKEICRLVHEAGGLCYCDGANFNAIMGRVRPGDIGFDVMHVNLHKSFSTPHGGGGPGSGPIGVAKHLTKFLPVPRVRDGENEYVLDWDQPDSIGKIAPFYGNFGVILKAYCYMLTLGKEGFLRVSENAVLNANYIRVKLEQYFPPKYPGVCMHECVLSAKKQSANSVHALDIAKALIDRGIHPPTMYFPLIVPEALMVEPTETESKETLDNFIEAMIELAQKAERDPASVINTPLTTPVGRLDETKAARNLLLSE